MKSTQRLVVRWSVGAKRRMCCSSAAAGRAPGRREGQLREAGSPGPEAPRVRGQWPSRVRSVASAANACQISSTPRRRSCPQVRGKKVGEKRGREASKMPPRARARSVAAGRSGGCSLLTCRSDCRSGAAHPLMYRLFSRKMPFLCPHPDGPLGPNTRSLRLSVRLQ